MKTSTLTRYIAADTHTTRIVYETLLGAYTDACRDTRPAENTFGLFFGELLKFLTGSILRGRELDHNLVADDRYTRPLTRWPYLGYDDLRNGVDPFTKIYGRSYGTRTRPGVMHLGAELLSAISGLHRRKTVGLMNTGYNRALVRACIAHGYKVRFCDARPMSLRMPDVDVGVSQMCDAIDAVHARTPLPLPPTVYRDVFTRHVSSMVSPGMPQHPRVDVLVRGSGSEFMNRALSHVAALYGIPVVDVVHGEGFGLLDEPTFGIGEQYLADAIVGYGSLYRKQRSEYLMTTYTQARPKYYSTRGAQHHHIATVIRPLDLHATDAVYYFPTVLSGDRYRYGPYRDMPDTLYLAWQRHLTTLFDRLYIKAHPKERFHTALRGTHAQYITEDLRTIIDRVDVFVFDYISSAFFLAAATDKPIIFLDLGLRNIAPHARALVKERTHYIDVTAMEHLSRAALHRALAADTPKNNALTHACVSDGVAEDRCSTIIRSIEDLCIV